MAHVALDPGFRRLIDEHAPVLQVGSGFTFTEGPIWHPSEHYLLFSDMPADMRRRLDRAGVRENERPSNKSNGLTYDADLNLLICEHATSSVVRVRPNGMRELLASHYQGRELNSPNDLCVKSDGAIYFTDPWYGRMPVYGVERPRQLGWQGVFRIRPGAQPGEEPQLVVDRYIFSHFASGLRDSLAPGLPDGMKCDTDGDIWCPGPGGIWVYAPSGKLMGKAAIPEMPANLHWGGADWRTLYVCATTSVYAIPVKIGPRHEPFMAVRQTARETTPQQDEVLRLDPSRCALIIQDMQNDVVMDGGAFASSGSPDHCRQQNAIPNIARLAAHCRSRGIPVIHVWFVRRADARDMTLNAPLFEGCVDANAMIEGTWGAEPVPGLEAQSGDHIIRKARMSAWEGTALERILKAEGRDIIIETGAWTNMSIEHTARTGADKGYIMVIPEDGCSTMNAELCHAQCRDGDFDR